MSQLEFSERYSGKRNLGDVIKLGHTLNTLKQKVLGLKGKENEKISWDPRLPKRLPEFQGTIAQALDLCAENIEELERKMQQHILRNNRKNTEEGGIISANDHRIEIINLPEYINDQYISTESIIETFSKCIEEVISRSGGFGISPRKKKNNNARKKRKI